MACCEYLRTCAFFNRQLADMPLVSDIMRERYCLDDWRGCARHLVSSRNLPPPDDLYPDDAERAAGLMPGAAVASPSTRPNCATPASECESAPLRAGVGTSELADAREAGRRAAADAVGKLGGEPPALVLTFASVRYDLPSLLSGIREVTGDTPLVGGSSSGHFHNGTLTDPGRGVTVLALTEGPYRFGIGSAAGLREHPSAAGRALAESAKRAVGDDATRPHSALLAFPCGVNIDHQQFVNGIHRVAGTAVPVVGGATSDDRQMRTTYVFRDGEVYTDAAVGVWIRSPYPLAPVRGHGWRANGLPLAITGVDGTVISTIAGRPAIEVFRQHLNEAHTANDLGAERPDQRPAERVVRLAEAGRCLGIIEPDGSRTLRGIFADENGNVATWLPLPPYTAVQIMTCTQDELLSTCDELPAQANAGRDATVLLAFSCVARLRMLGERGPEEAARLQTAAGETLVFGFYSYGELARSTNANGVHNATITAIAL